MMRRTITVLLSLVVLQLAAPKAAFAWWDYIEQLSGPGPLRGFDYEARLICLAKQQGVQGLENVDVAVAGLIHTFCDVEPNQRRVLSLDFGVRYVRRSGDPRFAEGQAISLMTFELGPTWNFIQNERYDVVEAGFGVGVYWFHSSRFDDFAGFVVDPRLDFRFPSTLRQPHWFLRPVVRFGWLGFPAGFTEEQFATAPGVMIHERTAKYVAFFWDLKGL
jgi:hypothetical protein